MSQPLNNSRERRVDELVAAYIEACERGEQPDPAVWIRAHDDFAPELRAFLSDWDAMPEGAMKAPRMRAIQEHLDSEELPQLDDFRLLRIVGRGGMGAVYEAEQISMRRRVAVKAMAALARRPATNNDPAGQDELRDRFIQEAELTGKLQHPSIVPVYVAGASAQGEPFYAMRLIDGENLQDAIDAYLAHSALRRDRFTSLEFRQLLKRFIDVCNAIEFAHSHQVIHRDIKPRNIMVGRFGEALVVDWGLAKNVADVDPGEVKGSADHLRASPHVSTEHGARIGTPAFMSPEQAAGETHSVSAATDIYGLGATLYCMLTGRAPVAARKNADDPLASAGEMALSWAQLGGPQVPPALQAICQRAMAFEAGRRYATSRDVAQEIERWLADEPVHAYAEPWWTRAQRFLRRHQTMSTGVSAAALVTTMSLAIGSWLLAGANRREQDARTAADQNFRLAHQAVNDYFENVVDDERLIQEDLRPLRRELLRSARDYYERFVAERGKDPALRAELGVALGRLAFLVLETEPKPRAMPLYQRAIDVFEELAAADPAVELYWDQLSTDYNDLGLICQELGRLDEAEEKLQAALAIRERLVTLHPQSDRYLSGAAKTHSNLGMLYRIGGRLEISEEHHLQANELWKEVLLTADKASLNEQQSAAAQARYLLGNLYYTRGELDKAEECYRDSIESYQALADAAPRYVALYKEMPGVVGNLASVYFDRQKYDEAEQLLRNALPRLKQFVLEHPSLTQHRFDLGKYLSMLADACRGTQKLEEAIAFGYQAIEALAAVAAEHPDIVQYRSTEAGAYDHLGMALDHAGRYDEACAAHQQAIDLTEKLLAERPELVKERINLGGMLANYGNSLCHVERDAEALAFYDRAERELAGAGEGSPFVSARDLANTYVGRARLPPTEAIRGISARCRGRRSARYVAGAQCASAGGQSRGVG